MSNDAEFDKKEKFKQEYAKRKREKEHFKAKYGFYSEVDKNALKRLEAAMKQVEQELKRGKK